jgi:hypothetical protein
MDLDHATRAELASFFARRFPTAALRARVAGHAGLPAADLPADATAAWRALVDRAVDRGRLDALLDAARAAAPGDANLEELRRLLVPAPRAKGSAVTLVNLVLVLAVTVAGVAIGIVVPGMWRAEEASSEETNPPVKAEEPPAAERAATEQTGPDDAGAVPAAGNETLGATPPATDPPAEAAGLPPDAPTPAPPVARPVPPPRPEPVVEGEAAVRPPAAAASRGGGEAGGDVPFGCNVLGDRVGWWFQPGSAPGEQGDTITLPSSLNVRLDFPRAENGYSRGADVVCRLRGGTRYTLSQAPVRGGPSGWWVPVTRSDLGG